MKPHRTPLLANAVTGSVRSPAQGSVVPAPAYAAHTPSSPSPQPDDSQPRLTDLRESTALRERLSQTRARIARAHAERPPQIDLEWDADEPLTRVYQGERLPLPRSRNAPAPSPPNLAAHAHATHADHTNDAWYSDLHAHSAPAPYGSEPSRANLTAQHAHAAPTDPARAALAAQQARSTQSDHAREPAAHAKHGAAVEPARPFVSPPHARANRVRARAEARVQRPVPAHSEGLTQPSPAHALADQATAPPSAARTLQNHISTQRERLLLAATSTLSTLSTQVGQLYAGIDRSNAALRKRVAYCSLGLLIVAAVSLSVFGGATSEPGASKASQAAATQNPATLQPKASVSISSDPPGALISLDGQAIHQATPFKLTELAPGRHTISLQLAGYAETKEALNLPADALVAIKLASLSEPRFAPEPTLQRTTLSRAEQRAQARELARERRAAARAAKVLLRYRARMGLPPDPVAQELVDAYGPSASAE